MRWKSSVLELEETCEIKLETLILHSFIQQIFVILYLIAAMPELPMVIKREEATFSVRDRQ